MIHRSLSAVLLSTMVYIEGILLKMRYSSKPSSRNPRPVSCIQLHPLITDLSKYTDILHSSTGAPSKMGLSLIVKYDCGCLHSSQTSRCSKCIEMDDPDICSKRIIKLVILPASRKCTEFEAQVLEAKCRRPHSWELPLAVVSSTDTTHGNAKAPIAQSQAKGQDTPGFQLHNTHNITDVPIPRGTWVNGRWQPW